MKHWARTAAILIGLVLSVPAWAARGSLLRAESLRTAPAADAPIVAELARGTAVDAVGRQGGWIRVRNGAQTGWVRLLSVRPGQAGERGVGFGEVTGLIARRPDASRVVSVAGVRGLSEENLKTAKFNARQLEKLDSYAVGAEAARAFAAEQGLRARQVAQLPAPATHNGGPAWGTEP